MSGRLLYYAGPVLRAARKRGGGSSCSNALRPSGSEMSTARWRGF